MRKYFTRKEILETIIDHLENHYSGYYDDLHNDVFSSSHYIQETHKAKQAPEEYGVNEAVGKIYLYEQDHFGRVCTDLSDPLQVATSLWYILGHEALDEIEFYDFDGIADEETNRELIERLESELEDE